MGVHTLGDNTSSCQTALLPFNLEVMMACNLIIHMLGSDLPGIPCCYKEDVKSF